MEEKIESTTLTPYDLVAIEGSYITERKLSSTGRPSLFNNWSNWGNGPTDPGGLRRDSEKILN